ncbi:MAG: metallophosphoesterase [Alphaproteobacteria bacterium]|nr:metallophosphoesterase [Alphaproteobacteria bacterium]
MRIIQLSDSHLSRDKPARAAELETCIDHINAMRPQPDVVVHTGDVAHDGLIEDYAVARKILDRLNAPYFVLAGNRDNRRNLIEVFADGHHLRSGMAFVQYPVEDFERRLIMIDTVSNRSNKGHLCAERLQHIDQMLAIDRSRPAVLFLHHPPFEVSVGPEPFHFGKRSEAEALIAACQGDERIGGIYCGHVHRAFETVVGGIGAHVVSSVASDVRWDKPNGQEHDRPVFAAHVV